jgi:hypothetical protein
MAMETKFTLEMKETPAGRVPEWRGAAAGGTLLSVPHPVCAEVWKVGEPRENVAVLWTGYRTVERRGDGYCCEAELAAAGLRLRVRDEWTPSESDTWQVDRTAEVLEGAAKAGFRLRLDVVTAYRPETKFTDLRYFIPPALYDKNDLDEDGFEDYLGTQNLLYREDRLNMLSVMAYDETLKLGFSLLRADRPSFDDVPDRPNKERSFLQRTDIGSLGVWKAPVEGSQMALRAVYPFYEGERCHALWMKERPDWGSYWPAEAGERLSMSYAVRIEAADGFIDAAWSAYTRRMKDLASEPVPLPASAEQLNAYRLDALDRYYVEKKASEDPNEPAGYVLNCHPQNGEQLSNIIQFGFTGQNVLSAYNVLRYGLAEGRDDYVEKALKVVDFFVNKAHIRETGMFYNLYNMDKGAFDFWWTGLLLPLAYAEGERLAELMGPLYEHREFVIKELQKKQGSYLRCMNEDAHALMLLYRFELSRGVDHAEWLEAAKRYGEFLLRTQESDGTWYRAYTTQGQPITEPPIWFGTTVYERKSSTASSIPLLVELFDATGDARFLEAAKRAGRFVRETIVSGVKFNGGIHDSIYAKGQLIDNESIYFPMIALLALYKATKDEYFLRGAYDAAKLNASWTVLWDVPLPPNSTLARHGFRSTGIGACDTPGAGYVHPFELSGVPEMVEIAKLTGDERLFRVAELLWHGCNQTVATPENDWGYRYIGLQEEGYLISWWAWDDSMFGDTGFGRRWKGEGNKTCFPWIAAVAVHAYWRLKDLYGTADFSVIREK